MKALDYLRGLADDTRLRLYSILSQNELNVNEIVRVMEMGQSRVSRHLKILSDCGLLASRRDGLWVYYSAAQTAGTLGIGSAVRELMENEPQAREDLLRAKAVIRDRSRRTRQFFDSIAEDWESLKKKILGDFDLNSEIVRLIDECGTAVDVGCGTGDLIALLQSRARHVIGVDSSPGMLEQARLRFEDRSAVELRLGEVEHLPLRDGEADLAVVNMVLHHLSEPERGIREVGRTLKSGDLFLVAELQKHELESMRKAFGDRWLGFDRKDMELWLKDSGFALVEERSYNLKEQLKLIIYVSRKT
jgi:SAM-dependent methyltransferase